MDASTFSLYAFSKPPFGSEFPRTPVLCGYWPRRIVVRDGQQSESGTMLFGNDVPRATSSSWRCGMYASIPLWTSWSSVRIRTMFGAPGGASVLPSTRTGLAPIVTDPPGRDRGRGAREVADLRIAGPGAYAVEPFVFQTAFAT